MQIFLDKRFLKQYKKLPRQTQLQFHKRTALLLEDPLHPQLHTHTLKGKLYPLQSMNVTGNIRALFLVNEKEEKVMFYQIGTHSELYT